MAKNTSNKGKEQKKQTNTPPVVEDESNFPIHKSNYKLLLIGFGIIVLGFILMIGGGSKDPDVFNYDGLFGFQRRTLAPIIVLAGFAFEIYAIMRKPKNEE